MEWFLYILQLGSKCEEWDRLVQNPFLAFYQRWPWFAHYTPLLNLWNNLLQHSRCIFFGFFFLRLYSKYWINNFPFFSELSRTSGACFGGLWWCVVRVRSVAKCDVHTGCLSTLRQPPSTETI